VHETAGETLWFGGHQAHVYFTEHCGGMREAAADVWPAEQARYLQQREPDPYCVRRSPARWQTHLPLAQIGNVLRTQGWRVPLPIKDIRVVQRTAGGRARLLQVSGRGAPATIAASSFRFAVNRELGWNQIRSNWYTAAISNGELALEGKGYGHGAGLCQAGAYEMAQEAKSEKEILDFYFPGTAARISLARGGWQKVGGAGWTLLTTDPDPELITEGNAAWAKAQALLGPPQVDIHPVVQELPNTELFRQTTGEPGWVLASTRGSDIFLQPAAVRQAHGGTRELLLHEFLHALVEQESGDRTPLWLREGLVEILAVPGHNSGSSVAAVDPGKLDDDLRHPATQLASQQAHEAAARIAALLCKRYGVKAVRGFLRTGLPPDALRSLQPGTNISALRTAVFGSLSAAPQ
jgi:stage II sporulation protein D